MKFRYNDKDTLIYSINGPFVYVNAQAHRGRFENDIGQYKNIILRMREVFFIDIDGIFVFDEIIESIKKQNKNVIISGLQENIEEQLEKASKQYKHLKKDNFICKHSEEALNILHNKFS